MWTMVGWILGSVWFSVSVLSVFAIITDPPISVVGNNICFSCSVPTIQFLVILFPSEVVVCLDYARILSIQLRKYFAFINLILLLAFVSIFFASIVLLVIFQFYFPSLVQLFCLRLVLFFCLQLYSYFNHYCWRGSGDLSGDLLLSHFSSLGLYCHCRK